MSELQPGMLALVYGLIVDTEFNGAMVVLKYQITPDILDDFEDSCIGEWVVEHCGEDEGTFNSMNLLPIKPEADIIHEEDLAELEVR